MIAAMVRYYNMLPFRREIITLTQISHITGLDHRWRHPDLVGGPQWLGKTRVLPYPNPAATLSEIFMGRLDADLSNPHVHQNLHLPVFTPHHG